MKLGDKKPDNVVKFTGNIKTDVLSRFDKITADDEEQKLIELERKMREVNESAKKRF